MFWLVQRDAVEVLGTSHCPQRGISAVVVQVRDDVSAEDCIDLLLEITLTCRCWQETGRRQLAETVTGQRPVQQRLTVLALPLIPQLLHRPARPGDALPENLVKFFC